MAVKIVRFLGGLGNQMFQYALYKKLMQSNTVKADLKGFESYFRKFELEKVFGLKLRKASDFEIKLYDVTVRDWFYRKLRRILKKKNAFTEERKLFAYDSDVIHNNSNQLLWGYWQNVGYFTGIEDQLAFDFQFKQPLDQINLKLKYAMEQSHSVALHVRRGDYLIDPLLGGICDITYYEKAIHLVKEKIERPEFFVFSNEIEWCKKNLPLTNATFVTNNTEDYSYIDMQLMTYCKHNIIANSSFSWWGAWLNTNPQKIVIAPDRWANGTDDQQGVCPPQWIRI